MRVAQPNPGHVHSFDCLQELIDERAYLISLGFPDWRKDDYDAFVNACRCVTFVATAHEASCNSTTLGTWMRSLLHLSHLFRASKFLFMAAAGSDAVTSIALRGPWRRKASNSRSADGDGGWCQQFLQMLQTARRLPLQMPVSPSASPCTLNTIILRCAGKDPMEIARYTRAFWSVGHKFFPAAVWNGILKKVRRASSPCID